jgi:hypothetical protein
VDEKVEKAKQQMERSESSVVLTIEGRRSTLLWNPIVASVERMSICHKSAIPIAMKAGKMWTKVNEEDDSSGFIATC